MQDELIAGARNGDRTAFGQLLAEHYDFIHSVAWRWTGSTDEADDVTQDVCLRLGQAIRSFRGDSRFRTWLYTLTLNAVRDRQRRTGRQRRKESAYLSDPTTQDTGMSDEQSDSLWDAVRQLPSKQCDAVLLVYAEGLSHSAAADVLGCSESTISWHVHEARKRLRDVLGENAG